jgi:hypothetical protein
MLQKPHYQTLVWREWAMRMPKNNRAEIYKARSGSLGLHGHSLPTLCGRRGESVPAVVELNVEGASSINILLELGWKTICVNRKHFARHQTTNRSRFLPQLHVRTERPQHLSSVCRRKGSPQARPDQSSQRVRQGPRSR